MGHDTSDTLRVMNRDAAGTKLDASTGSLSQAPPHCARSVAVRCAAALLALGTGAFALAADSGNIYQAFTDAQLSEIASEWQSLTIEERRDYFIEIRRRMAEAGQRGTRRAAPPVRIVEERRFGRIIPQPDGSVLRIEGVVRYRGGDMTQTEVPPDDYGTGFEQRVEQTAEQRQPSSVTAPVVNVSGVGETEIVTEDDGPQPMIGELEQSAQGRE